ncbi:MAG: insulinase family protein, partial [Planctomycetota bacterium]
EPGALASVAVRRALAPYEKDDIRYVPTLEERIDGFRNVTIDEIRGLHGLLAADAGEVTAVGDFDPQELSELCEAALAGWTSDVEQARIPIQASVEVPGGVKLIETPDKANAVLYGGAQIKMRDDHPDYPALMVGNYILGAGALSSRLGDRVRQKEGLSYGVGSGVSAHPVDERTNLTLFAITNPGNKDRLLEVMGEEIDKLLAEGITEQELAAAQQGILQSSQLERTQDGNLAGILGSTIFAGRDMEYYAELEGRIAELDIETVNRVLKKYIEPDRIVYFVAGDFAKAKEEE